MEKSHISLVISLYNEEEGIMSFWSDLHKVLKESLEINFEVIWVNDGSIDKTQSSIDQILSKEICDHIKHVSIEFSKNFGHEAAMIAGIDNSTGSAIICMDSDGQHPPKEIPKMIAEYSQGNDIILMERISRDDNSGIKRMLSSYFYSIINLLSSLKFQHNTTDFFLISKSVAEVLKSHYREQNRFIRGFIQSVGFDVKVLPFRAPERVHGESHYSYFNLVKLAFSAIFSFSNKPLRLTIIFSVCFILFTSVFSLYSLYMYLYVDTIPSGYTSIILFLSFSFSFLFVTLTILSLYFEKAISEIRQRPIYIIKNIKKKA